MIEEDKKARQEKPGIPEGPRLPEEPRPAEVYPEKAKPSLTEAEKGLEEERKKTETAEGPTKTPSLPSPPPASAEPTDEIKTLVKQARPEQVKSLVVMAFKKGVTHAIAIAKMLKDPYLLDEFHDSLVDEIYKHLVEKGKIKPEK